MIHTRSRFTLLLLLLVGWTCVFAEPARLAPTSLPASGQNGNPSEKCSSPVWSPVSRTTLYPYSRRTGPMIEL